MWKMINYEVCGRSHLKNNIPCQDKTISKKHNDTYVIALADGAGSAKYSHFGAKIVVNTVSTFLTNEFDDLINEEDGINVKKRIFNELINDLENQSFNLSCDIKDLASTLLVVAIKDEQFIAMHLGDGVIGMIKNNEMKVASKPENGEFLNSTIFVTSQNAIQNLRLYKGRTENIDAFVIMSDGTAESFYDKRNEILAPKMREIFNFSTMKNEQSMSIVLKKFFNEVIRNRTFDDCSIALIVKDDKSSIIYNNYDIKSKSKLLEMDDTNLKEVKKKINNFEKILKVLSKSPCNIGSLSKKVYIKGKYLKRRVNYLEKVGLLKRSKSKYFSNISPS